MSITTLFPITDPLNYDYTASEIDITGGVATKKVQTYTNELFYASFDSNSSDATRSSGTATGTLSGAGSITGSQFDNSSSLAVSNVRYDANTNFTFTNPNIFTVKVVYTPAYSGTPASSDAAIWQFRD